ncbi:MAG: 30S ribosomal protein S3 [Firmicutes bacterium]|nr:30S ribosomal protein S3 [Bacillota bacterium]MBQ4181743.1 30S ribosomal protein S3 [Bacillota bacterium]MBQ6260221.1 30S ribosomal protein S3 [Bacillota bacterium]MBR0440372.1 30S ribosomal protein S3 [Bacillota bacterium]MBR0522015.1 30S ribosomal protein S3 [Bacillota bacterium]
MGQKVSPHGFRVGVIQDWDSKWYANKKNFSDYLVEDNKVREFVKKRLFAAGVSKVVIERAAENQMRVSVLTAKPGMVIGRGGDGIDQLKTELEKLTGKKISVNIVELRRPDADAQLTAESIAQALEKRTSFRRAMKQAIQRAMKAGAKGIKVVISGRVGGAEIARSEKYSEGNVPLHTLRANIDYGFTEADTQYGRIGVKVWINVGEVLGKELVPSIVEETENRRERGNRREGRGRRDGERRERRDRDGRGDRRGGRFEEKEVKKFENPRKRPVKPQAPVEPQETEAPAETAETAPAEE